MPTAEDEDVTSEPLADGRVIYISRHSRFGTDAVLLASFAEPRRVDHAVDLCSGGGIIPLLWLDGDAPADVTGVEIQPECCALAERSIAANGDRARFRMIQGDLRRVEEWLPRERYTLVTCNPPYFAVGSGFDSKTEQRRIARSEELCNSGDVCRAARYLLQYGGRLCVCQRPERLTDVICAMRENGIEPKRLRLVQQREDSVPWLALLEGRRGGRPGLKCLPTLTVEGSDGKYTSQMKEIYGRYGESSKWRDS